jgi:hypothetical protein
MRWWSRGLWAGLWLSFDGDLGGSGDKFGSLFVAVAHIFRPRSVANLPQLTEGSADVILLLRSQESVWLLRLIMSGRSGLR